MATNGSSDSEEDPIPSSSPDDVNRSAPNVSCFSDTDIVQEKESTEKSKNLTRKNAFKKKKYSDTAPSNAGEVTGSFKRSNSTPELKMNKKEEEDKGNKGQGRRKGVQFHLPQSPLEEGLVTRSLGIARIPSPLVTSAFTYSRNRSEDERDSEMELVDQLDPSQYHLSEEDDDYDSIETEEEEEEEGGGVEGEEDDEITNAFDIASLEHNTLSLPPSHARQISNVSLGGYHGDEEVVSDDDRWMTRPSDETHMTRLHSQELLNELFFKFKYILSSSKHQGRRRSWRKRAVTATAETMQKTSALDTIQRRNTDTNLVPVVDQSLSEQEEEEEEEKKKKIEIERNRNLMGRRATLEPSVYETKKRKKERFERKKNEESPSVKKKSMGAIASGGGMSPQQRKARAQSVVLTTQSSKWDSGSPDLSMLRKGGAGGTLQSEKKKLPSSPKAAHVPLKPEKYKLHNPKSAEKLRKHLAKGKYDQVLRDHRMDTPIHAIVRNSRRDKLECLLVLLVYSDYGTENIDMPAAFGNTALHIAVQQGDLLMAQFLLVFGANIDALNDQKKTPLDMLINKGNDKKFFIVIEDLKRLDAKHGLEVVPVVREKHHSTRLMSISSDLPEKQEKLADSRQSRRSESIGTGIEKPRALSTDGLSPAVIAQKLETNLNELYEEYDLITNLDVQMAIGLQQFELHGWKKTSSSAMKFNVHGGSRILFLDGGGIRGLIQIEVMSIIEQRTGRTITELFDWIVGTSTGGIVALGLVYGKKTLAELRQFYFKLKEDVFTTQGIGGLGGYNTDELERILKEVLGTEKRMSDVKEPKVLISAVNKSTTNLQLNFFNNCFDDGFSHELVWKVARYTSAAPGYFSECDDYVDGGVLANNPNDYGLTAIQNFHRQKGRKLDIACVVSIGTGIFPAAKLGSTDAHRNMLSVKTLGNLITLLTKALVESEDVAMNCKSRCEEQHIPFFRFCPRLSTEVLAGETDSHKLIEMILQTKYQAVEDWEAKLDDLAYIFSRIEEYSRREMLQNLRNRRRLRTMPSQNDIIEEER